MSGAGFVCLPERLQKQVIAYRGNVEKLCDELEAEGKRLQAEIMRREDGELIERERRLFGDWCALRNAFGLSSAAWRERRNDG